MSKILMCFEKNKKILLISEKNPLQQIYQAAQQFTDYPLVQYFDPDFEDWIDIDEGYIPKAKDKLMVFKQDSFSSQLQLEHPPREQQVSAQYNCYNYKNENLPSLSILETESAGSSSHESNQSPCITNTGNLNLLNNSNSSLPIDVFSSPNHTSWGTDDDNDNDELFNNMDSMPSETDVLNTIPLKIHFKSPISSSCSTRTSGKSLINKPMDYDKGIIPTSTHSTVPLGSSCAASDANLDGMSPNASSKSVIIVEGENEKPIPNPLPLPLHFQPDIELGIKKKEMDPKLQGKLLSRVANTMFGYKRYPTKEDYVQVAKEVLQRWPFLQNPMEQNTTEHIVKTLQSRFNEFRRISNTSDNVSYSFQSKRGRRNKEQFEAKKIKLETPPKGEDKTSFERHNKKLLQEYKKPHPIRAVVAELMNNSFEMRRNDILTNPMVVTGILKKYPFLKDKDEILSEMCRIMHSDIVKDSKWTDHWMPRFLKVCCTNFSGEMQLKATSLRQQSIDLTADKVTIKLLAFLPLLVPDHKVKPNIDKLVVYIPDTLQASAAAVDLQTNTPTLIIKDKTCEVFTIVEKQVLCKIPGELSLMFLLAVYYVFNMVYPPGLNSLFILLEKILLNIEPKKKYAIVSRIFTQLNTVTVD